jgi:TolB-like protein
MAWLRAHVYGSELRTGILQIRDRLWLGEGVTRIDNSFELDLRDDPVFSPADIHQQVERVLSTDGFKRSERIARFLRFVVTETIAGNAHQLKEYVIALEVFGRDASFDPRTSAVVRVEAGRLRHRLQEYFLGPGRNDPIHIALPLGTYVPSFSAGGKVKEGIAGHDAPLALPDKPSIAVLPFANIGDDPEQGYFADGIVEDLITALSRIHWLYVTARNSSFTYKGRAVDVKQVGREMGVRYVVEGSVRRAGTRIRISVQLIDAGTGYHLWANRFDRELEDIFVLQDEIIDMIAGALEPELGAAERQRAVRRPPDSLKAWGLYQRGLSHMYRFTKVDNREAHRLLSLAAADDPLFAAPLGAQAYVWFLDFILGFVDDPELARAEAVVAGRAAVARDGKDPMAHFGLGRAISLTGDTDSAISELECALDLNPNFALAHLGLGTALSLAGRHQEAIDALGIAIRLSPNDPILWTMENARAMAYIDIGAYDMAIADARRACRHPITSSRCYLTLVSAMANSGRSRDAEEARNALFELWPEFSMARFSKMLPFSPFKRPRWLEGLRKAGLHFPDTDSSIN